MHINKTNVLSVAELQKRRRLQKTGRLCGLVDKELLTGDSRLCSQRDRRTPTRSAAACSTSAARLVQGADMKLCFGLILLLLSGMLHVGSGLRCYKCSDYTGRCENVQECTYEDSCISLSERGGKTIRQCIRYTDCDISRLTQMFPSISSFTYRCCNNNLCNSGNTITMATPILTLVGSMLSIWWCWV